MLYGFAYYHNPVSFKDWRLLNNYYSIIDFPNTAAEQIEINLKCSNESLVQKIHTSGTLYFYKSFASAEGAPSPKIKEHVGIFVDTLLHHKIK